MFRGRQPWNLFECVERAFRRAPRGRVHSLSFSNLLASTCTPDSTPIFETNSVSNSDIGGHQLCKVEATCLTTPRLRRRRTRPYHEGLNPVTGEHDQLVLEVEESGQQGCPNEPSGSLGTTAYSSRQATTLRRHLHRRRSAPDAASQNGKNPLVASGNRLMSCLRSAYRSLMPSAASWSATIDNAPSTNP